MTVNECYKKFAELIEQGYGDHEVVFRFDMPYGRAWSVSKFLVVKDGHTQEIVVAAMSDECEHVDMDPSPSCPLPVTREVPRAKPS